MTRKTKLSVQGYAHHIIHVGARGEQLFRSRADYRQYRDYLEDAARESLCAIHAYRLLPNYVQLLVTPPTTDAVARLMQKLAQRYVQYFNKTHNRAGSLWAGRYRSTIVETGCHVLDSYRYIDADYGRNRGSGPRAICKGSSYASNAHGELDSLITPHTDYMVLGNSDRNRQIAYREFCRQRINVTAMEKIREGVYKEQVLGCSAFKLFIESKVKRRSSPNGRGGDRRSKAFQSTVAKAFPRKRLSH